MIKDLNKIFASVLLISCIGLFSQESALSKSKTTPDKSYSSDYIELNQNIDDIEATQGNLQIFDKLQMEKSIKIDPLPSQKLKSKESIPKEIDLSIDKNLPKKSITIPSENKINSQGLNEKDKMDTNLRQKEISNSQRREVGGNVFDSAINNAYDITKNQSKNKKSKTKNKKDETKTVIKDDYEKIKEKNLQEISEKDIKKNHDYAIRLKLFKKANVEAHLLNENLAKYRVRKKSISHDKLRKKLKSHYDLFHYCDDNNALLALLYSINNMWFGVLKKIRYESNIK